MSTLSMQNINKQIFHDGNIRVSPHELTMLNNQPPQLFKASHLTQNPESGYKVYLSGYAQHVLTLETKEANFFLLSKTLNQLRSIPRPLENGFAKKGSIDTRMIKTNDHTIMYKLISGQVHVFNIQVNDSIAKMRAQLEKPALYKVAKDGNGHWKNKGKVNDVSTNHAAVNGQSNTLDKAIWLMGLHLNNAYGEIKEFTLYHNPSTSTAGDTWESFKDKLGFTTPVTKGFSKALLTSQSAGNETKWVAHSQGAVIFSEAVRYILNDESSWAILGGFNGAFSKNKGQVLDKHSVTFHGNANNEKRSKILFERAGVKVLGYNSHPYDPVHNIAGLNGGGFRNIIGSIVYFNHVTGGSVQQSPHTLPYEGMDNWNKNMDTGPGKGASKIQNQFKAIANNLK